MAILGYGEDALTLAFLSSHLGGFLNRLNCHCDPEKCDVYYRVSFGRRRGFGEIDAVVVTPSTIYVCESKWNDRDRTIVSCVPLAPAQVRRDEIFQEIVSSWLRKKPQSWEDFCEQHAAGFSGFHLPGAMTTLAKNLLAFRRGGFVRLLRRLHLALFPE